MARIASITEEQVHAAADQIRATGAKPTARAVQAALGSGSLTTVLRHFQTWQARQAKTAARDVVLPTSLQRGLIDWIGEEIAAARAELQAELVANQQLLEGLTAENETLSSTIELQAEALESSQSETAELVGRLAQVESGLSRANDDAANERNAAERARTELAKAELRLEALPRLERDLDRLQADHEKEQAARVAAEQAAAVALARLEAMIDRATRAEAAGEKAEKQAREALQELTNARLQLQKQQAALEVARLPPKQTDAEKKPSTTKKPRSKEATK